MDIITNEAIAILPAVMRAALRENREHLHPGEMARAFEVNERTLRRWRDKRFVTSFRHPNGEYRYPLRPAIALFLREYSPEMKKNSDNPGQPRTTRTPSVLAFS